MANMENDPKAKEVLDQEVSVDELDAVAGGGSGCPYGYNGEHEEADKNNCVNEHYRNIYGGRGFPNCAATVEDGSTCSSNDACYNPSVAYTGITDGCSVLDCVKAWH